MCKVHRRNFSLCLSTVMPFTILNPVKTGLRLLREEGKQHNTLEWQHLKGCPKQGPCKASHPSVWATPEPDESRLRARKPHPSPRDSCCTNHPQSQTPSREHG